MRLSTFVLFALMAGIAVSNAAPPTEKEKAAEKVKAIAAEFAKLEGVWKDESITDPDGTVIWENKHGITYLVIKDTSFYEISPINGKEVVSPVAVRIDPTKEPKQMRFCVLNVDGTHSTGDDTRQRPNEIKNDDMKSFIYKIEGDKLLMAEFLKGREFPKEFRAVVVKSSDPEIGDVGVRIHTFTKTKKSASDFKLDLNATEGKPKTEPKHK